MSEPELVTLDDVASRMRVTVRQLRAQIAAGRLPAAKVGKYLLVRLDDVRALYAPVVRAPEPCIRRAARSERLDREMRAAGYAPAADISRRA